MPVLWCRITFPDSGLSQMQPYFSDTFHTYCPQVVWAAREPEPISGRHSNSEAALSRGSGYMPPGLVGIQGSGSSLSPLL